MLSGAFKVSKSAVTFCRQQVERALALLLHHMHPVRRFAGTLIEVSWLVAPHWDVSVAGVTRECMPAHPCGSHPRLCSRWLPVSLRLRRPLADRTTSPPPSGVVSAEVTLPPPLPPVRAGEALGLLERPAKQTLTLIVLLEAGR